MAFGYIYPSMLRRENRYNGEQGIFKTVSKTDEGWTLRLEDGTIESFLAVRSFEIITHYTPSELEKLYLTAEDGTRHGCVNETRCIVVASMKN